MALIPGLNWLSAGAGAIVTGLVAFGLHSADVAWLNHEHEKAMTTQATQLNEACAKDKATTKEANDGLQKQINTIAARLAAAKRVQPARCVILSTAGQTNPAASGGEHAGQNGSGISTDWLRDFAAECETYRQERITLETFVDSERAIHAH